MQVQKLVNESKVHFKSAQIFHDGVYLTVPAAIPKHCFSTPCPLPAAPPASLIRTATSLVSQEAPSSRSLSRAGSRNWLHSTMFWVKSTHTQDTQSQLDSVRVELTLHILLCIIYFLQYCNITTVTYLWTDQPHCHQNCPLTSASYVFLILIPTENEPDGKLKMLRYGAPE